MQRENDIILGNYRLTHRKQVIKTKRNFAVVGRRLIFSTIFDLAEEIVII